MKISDIIDDAEIIIKEDNKYCLNRMFCRVIFKTNVPSTYTLIKIVGLN